MASIHRRFRKDDAEYMSMVRRMIRGLSRRAMGSDPTILAGMHALHEELDDAIARAARSLNRQGYSWASIGEELGVVRQNAMRRYRHEDVADEVAEAAEEARLCAEMAARAQAKADKFAGQVEHADYVNYARLCEGQARMAAEIAGKLAAALLASGVRAA